MCDTVAQDDVRQNNFGVVDVNSAIGTDAQGQVISIYCRDSSVGDIAGKDDRTGDGMVRENARKCLDTSVGKGRGSRDESLVVRNEDGEICDTLDSVDELRRCEGTDCGAHANLLREARKCVRKSGGNDQDLVNLVDGNIVGGFDILKWSANKRLVRFWQHTA